MKIARADLLRALETVSPVVKSRTTIPILSMVMICAEAGRLTVTASNLDCWIRVGCNAEGDLAACCVPPGPLLALVEHGPELAEIYTEGSRLKVSCGNTGRLGFVSTEQFPAWPKEESKTVKVVASDLAECIECVSWAADHGNKRSMNMDLIMVVTKPKSIHAVAMNGRRAGMVTRVSIASSAKLKFLSEHARTICEILRSDASVSLGEKWISFSGGGVDLCVMALDREDLRSEVLSKWFGEAEACGEIEPEQIAATLSAMVRVAANERTDNNTVLCEAKFSGSSLVLQYRGPSNEFSAAVPVSNPESPKPPIAFDAGLLHDLLKHTPGDKALLRLNVPNLFVQSGDVINALALMTNPT